MNDTAILKNIQTGDLYRNIEGNTFKNLRTGVSGDIPKELTNKILHIDYNASMILNKYPHLEELIYRMKLKIEL